MLRVHDPISTFNHFNLLPPILFVRFFFFRCKRKVEKRTVRKFSIHFVKKHNIQCIYIDS